MKNLAKISAVTAVIVSLAAYGGSNARAGGFPVAAGIAGGLAVGLVAGAAIGQYAPGPVYYGWAPPVYGVPAPVVAVPAPIYYQPARVVYPYRYYYPAARFGFFRGRSHYFRR